MSQQTFANFIGINAASLSSIFNNRTKPTLNTVEAIKSKIPNLNTDWLMFGHGSMFESDDKVDADRTSENDTGRGGMYSGAEGGMPDLFLTTSWLIRRSISNIGLQKMSPSRA